MRTALSTGVLRLVTMLVCFGVAIPGMIVSSITDHNGAAIAFGVTGAFAALALIAATAVTAPAQPETLPGAAPVGAPTAADEAEVVGAQLEAQVEALVAAGADESHVRELVRTALRLERLRAR